MDSYYNIGVRRGDSQVCVEVQTEGEFEISPNRSVFRTFDYRIESIPQLPLRQKLKSFYTLGKSIVKSHERLRKSSSIDKSILIPRTNILRRSSQDTLDSRNSQGLWQFTQPKKDPLFGSLTNRHYKQGYTRFKPMSQMHISLSRKLTKKRSVEDRDCVYMKPRVNKISF